MKGTVNPFEPWRPVAARTPPPLHASRPWRPPPPPPVRRAVEEPLLVEPVNPSRRNKPPERPKRPQGRMAHRIAFVVLCLLGLWCLGRVGWFSGTHMPRLIALGASAGMFVGMALSRRRNWRTRLTWMTAALAFAGIALWFVPTSHGVNLWSAYRQVKELHALPAGDVAAYQRGAAALRTLVEDFPSFAADVSAAEQTWLRRTVDEAIEKADRKLKNDPNAALIDLHQLDKDLSQLNPYATVRKDLESARRRAVQACVKLAQQP